MSANNAKANQALEAGLKELGWIPDQTVRVGTPLPGRSRGTTILLWNIGG
jgi:hypothetical protein